MQERKREEGGEGQRERKREKEGARERQHNVNRLRVESTFDLCHVSLGNGDQQRVETISVQYPPSCVAV